MLNIKKLVGNKKFYIMVLTVAVPIMIQNGITNFVGLLNNIMVGRIGTDQMTGVAIVNQLIFVFNICIFGATSGAGIFGAQFFGCKNFEGLRNTFRFKYVLCGFMCIIAGLLFVFFGKDLISLYLHAGTDSASAELALKYGYQYFSLIIFSIIPFVIVQIYSSTLRETGITLVPMVSGITAVTVNLLLNYVLIYGKLGFPALGVSGAAIATFFSRIVEMSIIVLWTHKNKERNQFVTGVYRTFRIPLSLAKKILVKGSPLIANEALWACGIAALTQCYSLRGLEVVAALNISSTISNVFNIVYIAMGSSISILIGQLLGSGKMEEAKDTDTKLIFFSVVSCIFLGVCLALISSVFPQNYNTSDSIKNMASGFIRVAALCMPLSAFMHACYFTIRSGGNTVVTFFFDSVFVWVVSLPCAFFLSRYTSIPILHLYLACQLLDIIKCTIGFVLVKKGIWLNNIVRSGD